MTVHFMDEGLDSGDIALQARLTFPDGISGAQAEQMCAEQGGRLLLQAIRKLAEGDLPRRPQPAEATYQPLPIDADFRLNINWPARRVFNFMRGTQGYERPYPIKVAGKDVWLQTAVSFNPDQTQPEPIHRQADSTVSLQFNPGVLIAKTAGE